MGTLSAEARRWRVEEELPFSGAVEAEHTRLHGSQGCDLIGPQGKALARWRAWFQAVDMECDRPGCVIGIKATDAIVRGSGAEQVGQRDLQAISDIGSQHQRSRPLVALEAYIAGRDGASRRDGDDIAGEGEDHPVGIPGTKSVVPDHLIQSDDVSSDGPVARDRIKFWIGRLRRGRCTKCHDQQQPDELD